MILVSVGAYHQIQMGNVVALQDSVDHIGIWNYDTILNACKEKDKAALLAINGVSEVNIVSGYVIVYCKGAGIAPSSQDYGFYYTEENIPVGIGCNLDIVCKMNTTKPIDNGYERTVPYFHRQLAYNARRRIQGLHLPDQHR